MANKFIPADERRALIGRALRQARRSAVEGGLRQEDVAGLLGTTKGTVSAWETGRALPDLLTFQALARMYGTTVQGLLGEGPALSPSALAVAQILDQLGEPQRAALQEMVRVFVAGQQPAQPEPAPRQVLEPTRRATIAERSREDAIARRLIERYNPTTAPKKTVGR